MTCRNCQSSLKCGRYGVYCRLLGILLRCSHGGCKHYKEKDDGNAAPGDRNQLDGTTADTAE